MAWEKDRNNNPRRPIEDVTAKMMALSGELTDEQARATLAEFFFHNPAFLMDLVADVQMFPMQEVIIKGWMQSDYNMAIWGRGVSKSWTAALFAIIWAIFNPRNRVVIVSFAFRASRRILQQCEKFVNGESEDSAILLKACFPNDLTRKTDEWIWTLPNGATIQCLPLGDGKKIRGIRADTLIVDEFAYLPENIINEVIRPFLASNSKITEQLKTSRKEDKLVETGVMKEDERTVINDFKKVIFLSSACYQFEHMYKRYLEWVDKIVSPAKTAEMEKDGVTYFVSRLGYEAAPKGMLNVKEIEQAKKEASTMLFDREYKAIFTSDSGGYFKASSMANCSVKDGEDGSCLELIGDKESEYVLGIDQNISGSEEADHFAMCLMKIVKRPTDGLKMGMVVHSYALAGGNLSDHMIYLLYLMKHFNIVYIGIDASQGDENEFINSCNQSKLFKDARIEMTAIDADFKKDIFVDLPKQIKTSYSKTTGRIVQKQPFGSAWQRSANEYLQACFDHRRMKFAGKIAAHESAVSRYHSLDVPSLNLGNHTDFKDMSISEFIENQDVLLDLTRAECAIIQTKQTDNGTISYVLPATAKKTSGPNRIRRDSYSALLLCNWCVKMYTEAMVIEVQTGVPDFPYSRFG